MKKIALSIMILLLTSTLSLAQGVEDKMCFPLSDAKKMSVELQKGRVDAELIATHEKEIDNQQKVIETLNKKIAVLEETNAKYERLVKEHEKLKDNMEADWKARVAEAKPKLSTLILGALGTFATGLLIGLLL